MTSFHRYLGYLLLTLVFHGVGQVTSDFTADAGDGCLGTAIILDNISTGATSYEWDFCLGDFDAEPGEVSSAVSGLTTGHGYAIAEDGGLWYSFIVSKGTNSVIRLSHGSSPLNPPISTDDIGGFGLLTAPEGIDIINFNGNWYGIVGGGNNGSKITRIDFPSGLGGDITDITGTDIGDFGAVGHRIRSLDLVEDSGNLALVFAGYNTHTLYRVDYGNSFDNTIDMMNDVYVTTLTDLSFTTGFDIKKINGNYIVHALSINNANIVRLNFGNSLFNSSSNEGVYSISGLINGYRLFLIEEAGNYYGVVGTTDQDIRIFDFGSLASAQAPTEKTYTTSLTNLVGYRPIRYLGSNHILGVSGSSSYNLSFVATCDVSLSYSVDFEPSGVTYSSSGSKDIWLKASDSDGNESTSVQAVVISNNASPDINIVMPSDYCVASDINFSSSSSATIVTYTWDFGDGSPISNDETPTHSFGSQGTYTVRLDVSDGICDNFTEQEITIYPVPPTPTFTAPANECKNTSISFTNTTDESQHMGVITYEWDFDNDGIADATDVNPTHAFSTPGTKTITLKAIIPGCESTSIPVNIEVSDGPTSAFDASSFSICESESISFTDQSTNNPVSWEWDFDDGFSSTSQSPDHLFSESGNYNVALTVTDALGCQNTLAQEVSVSSLPSVSFDFDVPCTSADGIQFMDLSTVSGADIVSRTWYVGDMPLAEAQDQQNPILTFASEGTLNVRLETVSSNGCEASHSEDIQILSAPQPDFSMNIGCEGALSSFSDLTSSPGNQITSRLWTLDGTNYTTEDIDHTFSGPGVFEVTLEVTGQNFCSETITKEIEVLELLTVDFNVEGNCSNELIELSDQSNVLQDPVVSREWSLDGTSVGNGENLTLESLPDNTYELMLEVTTASGCIVSTTNNILINRAPQSVISAPKTFGVPGDAITFTNESTGGSSYHWLFNGDSVSDNVTEETFQFQDPGTYQISMVSDNDLGCSDTTTTSILIAVPNVDLSIGQFELVENDNVGTIFLEVQNNSNLPIDNTEVVIELENQFSVTEQVPSLIGIGESELISLNVGVPLSSNELSYLCVFLNSQYKGFDDNNPLDNEKCITIEPKIVVEAPFPNPVTDQVRVRLVAPSDGVARITLLNSAGKVEMVANPETQAGLNNFFLDLKAFTTGVYFIRLELAGTTSVQRIIKL